MTDKNKLEVSNPDDTANTVDPRVVMLGVDRFACFIVVAMVVMIVAMGFYSIIEVNKSKNGIFEAEVIEVGSTYARVLYFVDNTPNEVIVKCEDEQLSDGDIVKINVRYGKDAVLYTEG